MTLSSRMQKSLDEEKAQRVRQAAGSAWALVRVLKKFELVQAVTLLKLREIHLAMKYIK